MNSEDQEILKNALFGMADVAEQVNILLDGFTYLTELFDTGTLERSNFTERQISDAMSSLRDMSEHMSNIKLIVNKVHNGTPIRQNTEFKLDTINEFILHMDMLRSLLMDYEIHPTGYNAVTIGVGMMRIKKCMLHFS